MKKRKLLSLITLATCVIFLVSCQKNKGHDADRPYKMEANLIMNKNLFATSLKERSVSNIFEIKEVTRQNEMLQVKVKGGGSAESFQFIWDGVILFSYPASIQLLLKYDNSKQDFDPEKEIIISVNLQKILGDKHKASDFYFHVINGSKLQTVILDPNGSNTKENK